MAEVKPKAKLINYIDNPEKNVAVSARLCYADKGAEELMNEMSDQEVNSLVNKVGDLGHLSTFEHSYFYFHIVCSRVCSHQLVRKRIGFSYSQRSQRYISENNFDYIVPPSIKKNKNTYEFYKKKMETAKEDYNALISSGIAKEDARFLLPTIKTDIVVSANARALLDFFKKRTCNRAQWEIRTIAKQMMSQVKKIAPELFKKAGPTCMTEGYCPEGNMSCGLIDRLKDIDYFKED